MPSALRDLWPRRIAPSASWAGRKTAFQRAFARRRRGRWRQGQRGGPRLCACQLFTLAAHCEAQRMGRRTPRPDLMDVATRFGIPFSWLRSRVGKRLVSPAIQVSVLVIIQNDPRLIFVAVGNLHVVLEHESQRVGSWIVIGSHDCSLQYLSILLVRYTVTTSAGARSISTNTRTRHSRSSVPITTLDCKTIRPARTSILCPGDLRIDCTMPSSIARRFISNRA